MGKSGQCLVTVHEKENVDGSDLHLVLFSPLFLFVCCVKQPF